MSNLSGDVKLSFCQNQLIIDYHFYQADETSKHKMWHKQGRLGWLCGHSQWCIIDW